MKNFFTSCLGTMVGLIVFILLGITVLSVMVSSDSKVVINANSVLYLDLQAPIVEQATDDPITELLPGGQQPIGLLQLKEAIAHAKNDPYIEGIYLNCGYVMAGYASIAEIRESLIDFQKSGKWIVAYAGAYTEGAYYLSSVADQVYLNPEGQVEFNGLSVEVMFFKRLFDKLEIKPQVFRVGDFKSAIEPFVREDLSPENELQLNSLINGIYTEVLDQIAKSREVPAATLAELSSKMTIRTAADAVTHDLVDELYYDDQVRDEMRQRLNLGKDEKIDFVKYAAYHKSIKPTTSSNEVAVIVADGDIMPGQADNGVVGASTIVKEIRRARTSKRVKAIVIRVNSPGGVFQAGDEMWREIVLATKEKPVIASMSDYAASGGYYLAMACDTIVAQPNTITGSIGVFSVLFDLSKFLGNKIGITSDEVKTGEVGGLITVTRPLSDVEKSIWQKQTDEVYETFTRKAAEGRGMTQDEIKKIASGRVWTGTQAKENGLVDILGSYTDAIELAAEAGGVAGDYRVRYYPQPKTFLEQLTGGWDEQVKTNAMKTEMGDAYLFYQQWEKIKTYQGVQARFPFELEIK